jgi:hypothetical protein
MRRFRAVHEEVVKLDQDFGVTFSGVLTDDEGRVRALWGSYAEQVGIGGVCMSNLQRAVGLSVAVHMHGAVAVMDVSCRVAAGWSVQDAYVHVQHSRSSARVWSMSTESVVAAAALLHLQVDREEREWCAGLPTHVFAPWVERLVAQDAPGITAPPLPVK